MSSREPYIPACKPSVIARSTAVNHAAVAGDMALGGGVSNFRRHQSPGLARPRCKSHLRGSSSFSSTIILSRQNNGSTRPVCRSTGMAIKCASQPLLRSWTATSQVKRANDKPPAQTLRYAKHSFFTESTPTSSRFSWYENMTAKGRVDGRD